MNKKIILTRGIQGSGKSTWAKAWVAEDPEHRIRINNDDLRNMFGVYWVPSREDVVSHAKKTIVTYAMGKQYDIVVDNMNLNPKEVQYWTNVVNYYNGYTKTGERYEIEFKDFFIPLEECIRRDSSRTNPIGEKVIRDTWKRYKHFYPNL